MWFINLNDCFEGRQVTPGPCEYWEAMWFITSWTAKVVLPSSWNGIRNYGGYTLRHLFLLKGYQFTGDRKCLSGLKKYTITHGRTLRIPEYPEMAWLSEPKGSALTVEGWKVERLFPCAKRTLSMLEYIERFINNHCINPL